SSILRVLLWHGRDVASTKCATPCSQTNRNVRKPEPARLLHMSNNLTNSGSIKLRSQKVRSLSASCPPNEGVRNGLRRRVGERFHADAYALWASGDVFKEVARKCGVSERQVSRP